LPNVCCVHPWLKLINLCLSSCCNTTNFSDWISATTRKGVSDPTRPEEITANGLRLDVKGYTDFADRMIRAVYGKSRYSSSSGAKLFDDFISPSQEAFALLLYSNGYDNWVWMHAHASLSSDGSDDSNGTEGGEGDDGRPPYKYTKRTGDFTSRNGGWSKEGMRLYNDLYKTVQDNRLNDNGAFGRAYQVHRSQMSGKKRKRRNNDGDPSQQMTISDDLGQLLTAMEGVEGASGACAQV